MLYAHCTFYIYIYNYILYKITDIILICLLKCIGTLRKIYFNKAINTER